MPLPSSAFRLLFASGSHDPFVEAIEGHLAEALGGRAGQWLRIVENRRPSADEDTTIDLAEAVLLKNDQPADGWRPAIVSPPPDLASIVEDTIWFEQTAGLAVDRNEVGARIERLANHARCILQWYRPDAVLVWNGMLGLRAAVASLARERAIPVWYCERGPLPGSWYADRNGINAGSSLVCEPFAPGLKEALETPLAPAELNQAQAEIAETAQSGTSAWGQPPLRGAQAWRKQLGVPANQRILFFPLQVDADSNMRFFSPHFGSSLKALKTVCNACREAGDWYILVKPHPKGRYPAGSIAEAVGSLGCSAEDLNLHDALALATLVVTINSTVASEAVWNNKPVLQLGRGILSGQGVVSEYDPRVLMAGQLADAVRHWNDEPIRFARALRFYRYLRAAYLYQVDEPGDAKRLLDRIGQPTGMVRGLDQLRTPSDISRRFAWRPAADLLRRLSSRQPSPQRIVLLGYGQNAMRLIRTAELLGLRDRWDWRVWDDDPRVRGRAGQAGFTLVDPRNVPEQGESEVLIVTPSHAAALRSRLQHAGLLEGAEWLSPR